MRRSCVLHEWAGDLSHVAACTASSTSPLDPDILPFSPNSRFAVRRRQSCSWHLPLSLGLFGMPPLADEQDITHDMKVGWGQTALISCLLALSPSAMRVGKSVSPYSRFDYKEKVELLVVRSSIALSLRPALERYSPLTLRWGPQCFFSACRQASPSHSVKTPSLAVVGRRSIARVLPPPCSGRLYGRVYQSLRP